MRFPLLEKGERVGKGSRRKKNKGPALGGKLI